MRVGRRGGGQREGERKRRGRGGYRERQTWERLPGSIKDENYFNREDLLVKNSHIISLQAEGRNKMFRPAKDSTFLAICQLLSVSRLAYLRFVYT